MTVSKNDSLRQLVSRVAIHSQQYRLSDYSSRRLSPESIQDIGFKLVNLYEELFEQHMANDGVGAPPRKGTPTDPKDGESGRVATRSQPYR
jgi:hypothetical protein